jgi:SAM-dependent methyltransferase
MSQDSVFLQSEGDRWFERNYQALDGFDAAVDLPFRLMDLYNLRPRSVLEIGAANGFRLAAIHRRSGARVVAVEPSEQALLDGQKRFPFITFIRAVASAVPLSEVFDLVIVNFVFHWIDRQCLLRAVAEADRLVRAGGHLLIGDFHPANRLSVRYHHLEDGALYTFKQNYAATFLASGLYHPVGLLTADHNQRKLHFAVAENDRISAWLLQKELFKHYIPTTLNGAHEKPPRS